MNLETDRLFLRRWRPSDLSEMARINTDLKVMEFFPSLMSREQTEAMIVRIEKQFDERGFGNWAVEKKADGRLIGFIGLNVPAYETPFTPCVEVAWRLASEAWGQGFAPEGARRALDFGFNVVRLPEIVSFTAVPNIRSQRVMEKIGMTRDPEGDFDHPVLEEGHWLRRHLLYRKKNPAG